MTMERWKEIQKTSPSGKTLFVCLACGSVSPAPSKECSNPTRVYEGGIEYFMPCSAWPMKPTEYNRKRMSVCGDEAVFSGVVVTSGGVHQVTSPVPQHIVDELIIREAEFDLISKELREARDAQNAKISELQIENKRLADTVAGQKADLQHLQHQVDVHKRRIDAAQSAAGPGINGAVAPLGLGATAQVAQDYMEQRRQRELNRNAQAHALAQAGAPTPKFGGLNSFSRELSELGGVNTPSRRYSNEDPKE